MSTGRIWTRLQALERALDAGTTGGILPSVDAERRQRVLSSLTDVLGLDGFGPSAVERRRALMQVVEWCEKNAATAATVGAMPQDVNALMRDLCSIEACQRRVGEIATGDKSDPPPNTIHLDGPMRRAVVSRVERWYRDSRPRRDAEFEARLEAKKAGGGGE